MGNKEEKMKFSRDQGNTVPLLEVARASKDLLLISTTVLQKSRVRKSNVRLTSTVQLFLCELDFNRFRSNSIHGLKFSSIGFVWLCRASFTSALFIIIHEYPERF